MEKKLPKLLWDEWNTKHIVNHGVTAYEVEKAVKDKNAIYLEGKVGRQLLLGRFKKRLLAVVVNKDEKTSKMYVVTARDMDKKERKTYRKEKSDD